MAFDAFVKFTPAAGASEPIEGESNDTTFKGWFEIKEFSFGIENTLNITSASSGAGAGKAEFKEFTIKKQTDKASPILAATCGKGGHYDLVQLKLRKSGAKRVPSPETFTSRTTSSSSPSRASNGPAPRATTSPKKPSSSNTAHSRSATSRRTRTARWAAWSSGRGTRSPTAPISIADGCERRQSRTKPTGCNPWAFLRYCRSGQVRSTYFGFNRQGAASAGQRLSDLGVLALRFRVLRSTINRAMQWPPNGATAS